jgi:ribosome biogenesis protein ERB1
LTLYREDKVNFFVPPFISQDARELIQSILAPATLPPSADVLSLVKWLSTSSKSMTEDKPVLTLQLPASSGLTKRIIWHRGADYFGTICMSISFLPLKLHQLALATNGSQGGLLIHQMTRRHSQAPFKSMKGTVELALFHPSKPHFFVAVRGPMMVSFS